MGAQTTLLLTTARWKKKKKRGVEKFFGFSRFPERFHSPNKQTAFPKLYENFG